MTQQCLGKAVTVMTLPQATCVLPYNCHGQVPDGTAVSTVPTPDSTNTRKKLAIVTAQIDGERSHFSLR